MDAEITAELTIIITWDMGLCAGLPILARGSTPISCGEPLHSVASSATFFIFLSTPSTLNQVFYWVYLLIKLNIKIVHSVSCAPITSIKQRIFHYMLCTHHLGKSCDYAFFCSTESLFLIRLWTHFYFTCIFTFCILSSLNLLFYFLVFTLVSVIFSDIAVAFCSAFVLGVRHLAW